MSGHCLLVVQDPRLDRQDPAGPLGLQGLAYLSGGDPNLHGSLGVEPVLPSLELPETLCFEAFPLSGSIERRVPVNATGTCRVSAFLFSGYEVASAHQELAVGKLVSGVADLPQHLVPGEQVAVSVRYGLPGAGEVVLNGKRRAVQGQGWTELPLEGPGPVALEILAPEGQHRVEGFVGPPGRERVTLSRLVALAPGDSVEGPRVTAYRTPACAAQELVQAQVDMPFENAEGLSSALLGLLLVRQEAPVETLLGRLHWRRAWAISSPRFPTAIS